VFFQSREAGEPFYAALPASSTARWTRFAELTGRRYRLFDYVGHPEAERVIVIMGSGGECVHETVEHLVARGEKVGVVKVRLFRPFGRAPARGAAGDVRRGRGARPHQGAGRERRAALAGDHDGAGRRRGQRRARRCRG
jgi:pyruvate/2-oxoacid:ferredoxin oxidoreductase alpha subunit